MMSIFKNAFKFVRSRWFSIILVFIVIQLGLSNSKLLDRVKGLEIQLIDQELEVINSITASEDTLALENDIILDNVKAYKEKLELLEIELTKRDTTSMSINDALDILRGNENE